MIGKMDLNVHIYRSVAGNKNVWISVDDNIDNGERFEVKDGETVGSVIDQYLEDVCGTDKIWD